VRGNSRQTLNPRAYCIGDPWIPSRFIRASFAQLL
jgi:hypothetical protein